MDESTSNILEMAFLLCVLVIVAMLSVKDVFYVKANLRQTEMADKASGLEYSTLINSDSLEPDALEEQLLAIVLASDTDKMARLFMDVMLDGVSSGSFEIVGNDAKIIIDNIFEGIAEKSGITDRSKYKFEFSVGLSETVITVYVTS